MFAALYVPEFPLQVVLRHEPELREAPVAVIGEEKSGAILHASVTAQAAGVTAGMTGPQAMGRCTALVFRTPSAALLDAAQEALVQLGAAHSPFVESTGPGVCTLDWKGNARADFAEQAGLIIRQAARMGLSLRVGVAANPDLALLVARRAEPFLQARDAAEFLAPLPVSALNPTHQAARLLSRWGIHTLGDLVRLPPDQLTERLGPEGTRLWEMAAGRSERPLRLIRPENRFEEAVEFECEIETIEPLLFILRRFLGQICERLELFGLVTERLDLRLTLANKSEHERRFHVPAPTRDIEALFRIVHTHLDTLTSDSPIIALRVEALACHPRDRQLGLFEGALRNPHRFFDTLAQLAALTGPGRIGTPILADSHRSDAFLMQMPDFEAESVESVSAPSGLPLARCRPPMPIHVATDEARPSAVFSEACAGPVRGLRGPWKISGDWWTTEPWSSNEWDVEIGGGIYRIAQRDAGWFLEGIYG
jgi:protein ImuB